MKYLLDTDTCIAVLRGEEAAVSRLGLESPDDIGISSITRYELLYGVERCDSARRLKEKRKVERFLEAIHEIPFFRDTARLAATIRRALEKEGFPIGPMDLLIAATARESGLTVITGNLAEFSRVPRLTCETWRD